MSAELAHIRQQLAKLDAEFRPTLDHYQKLAAEVLVLQKRLADALLKEAFPKARVKEASLVTRISARHHQQLIEAAIEKVVSSGVQVEFIIYDDVNFSYEIYGTKPS